MRLICEKDIGLIQSISRLCVSPDGRILAFCLESTKVLENRCCSHLCIYEMESGRVRRLSECGSVRDYCFDQNGMLIFSSDGPDGSENMDGCTEFRMLDPESGDEKRAFTLPLAHARAGLIRGERFVISAPWDLELEKLKAAGDGQAVLAHLRGDVIVCDEYPYRIDGQGYVNKKRNRLFEYHRADDILKPITPPTFSQHDYAADGGRLYVLGEDYALKTSGTHSIYCWDGGNFRQYAKGRYMFSSLAASGGRVFAAADTWPEDAGTYVYTADEGDGELSIGFQPKYALFNHISLDFPGGCGRQFLAVDGRLYYTLQNRRGVRLYENENGRETVISPEGVDILHFTVTGDGRVFAAGLPEFGGAEIYEISPDRAVRLTSFHEKEFGQLGLSRPEHLVFTAGDGCEIDGWVVPPADYSPDKRYPAILNIHGGPQLRYYGGFNFSHQLWAAKGYYVIYCNPHGSIGDTAQFSDLRQKYGTIDYQDIMQFVDAVLAQYPSVDEHRMGVTGISYGGFMTNLIITESSRFAAAASQAGISDWISLHATDDLPGFDLTITGSFPWEDIREHWRISPLARAGRCRTPTLFIECGEDYRCPADQGLGMYQALIQLGVPTRAVIINGETHCVFRLGKPLGRIRILKEISDWFERYIPKS